MACFAKPSLASVLRECWIFFHFTVKEDKIRFYASQMSIAEATKKLNAVQIEIEQLEAKLKKLTEASRGREVVTAEAMNKARAERNELVKEWRKRKRMFDSVADAILEAYDCPKKQFYEEIGAETDQDAGVKFPDQ